jgi:hypothetical protein
MISTFGESAFEGADVVTNAKIMRIERVDRARLDVSCREFTKAPFARSFQVSSGAFVGF